MSADGSISDSRPRGSEVRKVPILLQKSKIEHPKKSPERLSLGFSGAAALFSSTTETGDRFWMKRYGPSRRRAQNASAGSKNFHSSPQKTFATISARLRNLGI